MPVAKGTPLDPARTREAMLDRATDVFYRRGLDGAGIAELCAQLGASKQTLYRHFGSKDGLIAAVLEARSRRVTAWLRAAAEAGSSPAERLAAVFDALGSWYAEPGFRGCAIVNAATQHHDDPPRAAVARHLERYLDLLRGIASDAATREPEALARQWLLLLEGSIVLADHHGWGGASADVAKRAATDLLRLNENGGN
ncbi:MAG TPA: TetR/AcrR family transcriptional regulator [Stackebrandtia sp.]|uniref:TetR/AcrR family transcriptional regulator n=1 Tax=Stackebrandtia sp. TaxID=2023065 RepID=UPI002D3CD95A|nr:TetR/AcrR family transcriptional regulator [Stackebrandtia sp.]HZE39221.1 TetR/AcrR family transcriptional regulator [Stackebrandtia sp.]